MQLACDILIKRRRRGPHRHQQMLAPVALAKIEGCWYGRHGGERRGNGGRAQLRRPILAHGAGKSYSALADALRGYGGGLSRPAGKVLAQGRFEAAPGEVDGAVAARQRPRRAGNSAEARNILASALKSRETNAPIGSSCGSPTSATENDRRRRGE